MSPPRAEKSFQPILHTRGSTCKPARSNIGPLLHCDNVSKGIKRVTMQSIAEGHCTTARVIFHHHCAHAMIHVDPCGTLAAKVVAKAKKRSPCPFLRGCWPSCHENHENVCPTKVCRLQHLQLQASKVSYSVFNIWSRRSFTSSEINRKQTDCLDKIDKTKIKIVSARHMHQTCVRRHRCSRCSDRVSTVSVLSEVARAPVSRSASLCRRSRLKSA